MTGVCAECGAPFRRPGPVRYCAACAARRKAETSHRDLSPQRIEQRYQRALARARRTLSCDPWAQRWDAVTLDSIMRDELPTSTEVARANAAGAIPAGKAWCRPSHKQERQRRRRTA